MDYKYITQLLERYWECQTTLEEENILRAFFSQDDIPASLLQYRDLFVYETVEPKTDVLGQEFDDKILAIISEGEPVKASSLSEMQCRCRSTQTVHTMVWQAMRRPIYMV